MWRNEDDVKSRNENSKRESEKNDAAFLSGTRPVSSIWNAHGSKRQRAIFCGASSDECRHGQQCKPNSSLRHEQQTRMQSALAGISLRRDMWNR